MERLGIIMDKEQIREYTARISQSNKSGLVTIIYELFAYSIDMAEQAFNSNDKDKAVKYLRKAQDCVCELKRSLDSVNRPLVLPSSVLLWTMPP